MIDSHLHLQDPALLDQTDDLIATVRSCGIETLVVNGTCPEDWSQVAELAESIEEVIPFYGLHPWRVNETTRGWESSLRALLEASPNAGLGEIGLDKWIRDHNIPRQKDVFLRQLEMAREFRRPAAVHCLRAWGHLVDCFDASNFSGPFLLHSFSGPIEFVDYMVEKGGYFSISGYFFREDKKEKLKAFEAIPDDRILLETDAPDMLPPDHLICFPITRSGDDQPVNHPANLVGVYEAYADWRGISLEETIVRMRENFRNWYDGQART